MSSNDSFLYRMRKGDSNDPYIEYEQIDIVRNNRIILKEIPDKFQGLIISKADGTILNYSDKGVPDSDTVIVDWKNSELLFHDVNNGETITISFYGKGNVYVPANRVSMNVDTNGNVVSTLRDLTDETIEARDNAIQTELAVQDNEGVRQSNESTRQQQETNRQENTNAAIARVDGIVDETKFIEPYNASTSYKKNNIVSMNGASYIAKQDTVRNSPTGEPTDIYWGLLARRGDDGTGTVHRKTDEFIATEGQQVFTLSGTYDQFQSRTDVYVGGVAQRTPDNYEETSSNTITLSEAVSAGVEVVIKYFTESIPLQSDIQQTVDGHTTTLNTHTSQITDQSNKIGNLSELNTFQKDTLVNAVNDTAAQLAQRPTQMEVDNKVAQIVSGSPKETFSTLSALQSAYPSGAAGIYLVSTDGKWYYWNSSVWTAGGVYQSAGIADNSITNVKTNFVYKRASVALGNIRVNTATKTVSWDNLVVVYEEHYKQPVAGSKTYSSTLSNIYYNQGTNTIEVYTVGNFTGLTTPLSNLSLLGTIYGSKLYNVITPEFWLLNNISLVPPTITQNPKSFWEGKKANFIGDSITDYSTYPEKVKEILGLSVARNYGVGGGSLCYRNGIYPDPTYGDNGDQMIDDAYPPVLSRWQDMDDDADVIFVLIGTNDYSAQVPLGSVSIYSDTEFNGGLNTLLDGLRTKYPTKLIVVSNLLRRLNDNLTIPLTSYNAAIKERCESRGIIFFDAYNGTGLDFKKDLSTKHTTTDGLHPNETGADILAHRIAGFINSK
jgi:lysophospholipase L1-like esterase